ncbi:hypothetical protein [Actibacterium sp. 188UL27-1]|uniref:hypothetical protein n=1 Tax=Actibacterium sp. 188UL27-1 TaxID=2786961 RepID=UPI00195C7FF3|nr:hypothetical protein [Actibacterium sp. 188UL27-1]MBM7066761.1 hypothetical protein [Actibacterium sp. 188UL27-1]
MADLLRAVGFELTIGRYSTRLAGIDHFVFREYGSDIGQPCITADHDRVDLLAKFAKRLSDALTAHGIRHRFEIYGSGCQLFAHNHHLWSQRD